MAQFPEKPIKRFRSEEEELSEWDNHPLFMKSLPAELGGTTRPGEAKGQPAAGGTETLEALQALMYEGDSTEIAADLKAHANELYAARKFKDAIGFYTRAIDEVGKDIPMEDQRVLWCNRAAANLELGNLGACLRDISLVLSAPNTSYPDPPSKASNKTTQKALLRSARALSGLDKLPEAMDALTRLRMLEVTMLDEQGEEDKDVGKKVREEVEGKMARKDKKERETAERKRREREGEQAVRDAFKLRGVIVPKAFSKTLFAKCPIDITPPHFDPDSLPTNSLSTLPLSNTFWTPPPPTTPLIFPVFLLLPLAKPQPTRDLCLAFHTSSTFGDVLLSMEHDPARTQLYIATHLGKVLKVGSKLVLGKVLEAAGGKEGKDGWVLQEGWALEMVGVPKGEEGEKWIQGWKEEVKANVISIL